jgi:flagellar hook-length control protein FliK
LFIAPLSSNLQPLLPNPASFPEPTPRTRQGSELEGARRGSGQRASELPVFEPQASEPQGTDRNRASQGRSLGEQEGDEERRSNTRFARLLGEKLRRLEERDGKIRPRPSFGKDGARKKGSGKTELPEEELLGLLRKAWRAARAGGGQHVGAAEMSKAHDTGLEKARGGEREPGVEEAGKRMLKDKKPGGETGRNIGGIATAALAGASAEASAEALRKAMEPAANSADPAGKSASRGSQVRPAAPGIELKNSPEGGRDSPAGRQDSQGAARLVVLDLRRKATQSGENAQEKNLTGGKAVAEDLKKEPAVQERDFAALLRSFSAERGTPAEAQQTSEAHRAPPSLRSFQERLIPEVLRHTGIILREGGSGEIRLLLKPESLGSVRIRLALSESSLEGRIVVENSTVKDLMDASLEHLKQALREGGFQSASLEVAVGGRQNGHQADGPVQVARIGGAGPRELEAAVPPLIELISMESSVVNLFV